MPAVFPVFRNAIYAGRKYRMLSSTVVFAMRETLICAPCKDDGAYCLDHHHALIQQALNNDTENPVTELSYCMHTFSL
jgi:hypothetical protein